MKPRTILLLSLFLLLTGGFAAFYVAHEVQALGDARQSAEATTQALVFTRDLRAGEQIGTADVRLVALPLPSVPASAMKDAKAVVGRALRTAVQKGEVVLSTRLAEAGSEAGLSATIPAGMRAMSVKVDEVVGVSGFVVPGTIVDVVAALSDDAGGDYTARTVLQHVRVLASGTRLEEKGEQNAKPRENDVVTLLVTPEEAEKLALATLRGRILLVLRNSLDDKTENLGGKHTSDLLTTGGQPKQPAREGAAVAPKSVSAPSPQPQQKHIEVISGGRRETLQFQQQQ